MDVTTLEHLTSVDYLGRSKSNMIRSYYRHLDDAKFQAEITKCSKAAVGFMRMNIISDDAFNSIDADGWQSILESFVSWKFHRLIDYEEAAAESKYELTTTINNLNNKTEFEASEARKNAESQRKNSTGGVFFF